MQLASSRIQFVPRAIGHWPVQCQADSFLKAESTTGKKKLFNIPVPQPGCHLKNSSWAGIIYI